MDVEALLREDVLYYPSVEFQDETWLKAALCVWERVLRIVPPDYIPADSPDVRIAVQEGVVRDIRLRKDELKEAAESFRIFRERLQYVPDGLDFSRYQVERLHSSKVDARLLPVMKELAVKVDADGWLQLPDGLAHSYMLFLSEAISRRRNLPKLTDSPDVFAIASYFEQDGRFGERVYDPDAAELYCAMTLETLMPGGLSDKSIEDVLRFRQKSRDGREVFRQAVMGFSDGLSSVRDRGHAQMVIDRFHERLRESQHSILDAWGQRIRDTVPALITVGMPTTLTAFGAFAVGGDPFDGVKLGVSGFLGAVAAIASTVDAKRRIAQPEPSSYYLQMDNVFRNKAGRVEYSISRFDRVFEEFMND